MVVVDSWRYSLTYDETLGFIFLQSVVGLADLNYFFPFKENHDVFDSHGNA